MVKLCRFVIKDPQPIGGVCGSPAANGVTLQTFRVSGQEHEVKISFFLVIGLKTNVFCLNQIGFILVHISEIG